MPIICGRCSQLSIVVIAAHPAIQVEGSATVRTQGAHVTDLVRRATGRRVGGVQRFADQAHALVSQDYRGDIDIHPAFHPSIYRKVVSNPTRADLDWFIRQGQRAVWPRLAMIRDHTRVGRAFARNVRLLAMDGVDSAQA